MIRKVQASLGRLHCPRRFFQSVNPLREVCCGYLRFREDSASLRVTGAAAPRTSASRSADRVEIARRLRVRKGIVRDLIIGYFNRSLWLSQVAIALRERPRMAARLEMLGAMDTRD
jgi:hypothetical protein